MPRLRGRAVPGKTASKAKRVIAASKLDRDEAARLAGLPNWAKTRIAELNGEVDRLTQMVHRLRTGTAVSVFEEDV